MAHTHTVDIPPPPFTDSIDELRSLSTALSTFLSRYDELHDHINVINASIDAKLRNHVITNANPSGIGSGCEGSPGNSRKHGSSDNSKKVEEIDVSKNLTPVLEEIPSGTASNCERSPRDLRKPESPKISKKHEEIDGLKNLTHVHEQNPSGTVSNCELSPKNSKKPESPNFSTKLEEIVVLKNLTHVREQNPSGIASRKSRKHESPDFSKKPEETDVSKNYAKRDVSESEMLNKHEEIGYPVKRESPGFSKKLEKIDVLKNRKKRDVSETDVLKKNEETDMVKKNEETDMVKKNEETDMVKKPVVSELESLCERMCGKGIKRYVTTRICYMNELLQELPKALKLAKDPAKLVLDSIGRFFIQGSRAYLKNSALSLGRLASVVILECFVMISSDGIEIAKEEETYAAIAAVDWLKRMKREGGIAKTNEADARGLLLLISGFGIPDGVFKNEDIIDLIRASNVKVISTALRRSIILVPRIPEIIDWMVKKNCEIEAVDIAYTFGLEDKCHPQTILTTFLRNNIQQGSSTQEKDAIKKQLFDLKTIQKCLEAHNVDPSKILPDYNIHEKIQQLQKEATKFDSKPTQKRKAKEPESSRKPNQREAKRTRSTSHDNMPHHPKPVHHYNGSTQTSSSSYLSTYPLHRPGLPEPMASSVAIDGAGGLAGGGPYGHGHGQPYGWDQDSDLIEKYLGQNYSGRVQGYEYDQQPLTTGQVGLYNGPSGSSFESFPGLPNSGPSVGGLGRAGPGSDLYSFADTVVESEVYRGSRASGSGTVRSSYLY